MCRLTGSNDVVHNQALLSRLNSTCLDLELVLAVFFRVFNSPAGTGHLALLSDRHKGTVETQGEWRSKEKTAGFQTHDDIWYLAAEPFSDQENENIEQRAEGDGVLEYREYIDELDTGDREVGFVS